MRCLVAVQPQKQAGSRRRAKGGDGGGCMPKAIMITTHRGADAAANLISGDHRTQECFRPTNHVFAQQQARRQWLHSPDAARHHGKYRQIQMYGR
jgi:hypothetical protein